MNSYLVFALPLLIAILAVNGVLVYTWWQEEKALKKLKLFSKKGARTFAKEGNIPVKLMPSFENDLMREFNVVKIRETQGMYGPCFEFMNQAEVDREEQCQKSES